MHTRIGTFYLGIRMSVSACMCEYVCAPVCVYNMVSIRLTVSLSPLTGSSGMILVQSIPIRKTWTPLSLANFNSVSGSDQNLSLSSLKNNFKEFIGS